MCFIAHSLGTERVDTGMPPANATKHRERHTCERMAATQATRAGRERKRCLVVVVVGKNVDKETGSNAANAEGVGL